MHRQSCVSHPLPRATFAESSVIGDFCQDVTLHSGTKRDASEAGIGMVDVWSEVLFQFWLRLLGDGGSARQDKSWVAN